MLLFKKRVLGDYMQDKDSKHNVNGENSNKKTKLLNITLCVSAALCIISLAVTLKFQFESANEIEKHLNEAATKNDIENLSGIKAGSSLGNFIMITADDESDLQISEYVISELTSDNNINSAVNTQKNNTTATTKNNITKENKTTTKRNITTTTEKATELDSVLIINKSSKKIHSSVCPYANKISSENRFETTGDKLQIYIDNGYSVCSHCKACK